MANNETGMTAQKYVESKSYLQLLDVASGVKLVALLVCVIRAYLSTQAQK